MKTLGFLTVVLGIVFSSEMSAWAGDCEPVVADVDGDTVYYYPRGAGAAHVPELVVTAHSVELTLTNTEDLKLKDRTVYRVQLKPTADAEKTKQRLVKKFGTVHDAFVDGKWTLLGRDVKPDAKEVRAEGFVFEVPSVHFEIVARTGISPLSLAVRFDDVCGEKTAVRLPIARAAGLRLPVRLTREDRKYVPLEQELAFELAKGADMFDVAKPEKRAEILAGLYEKFLKTPDAVTRAIQKEWGWSDDDLAALAKRLTAESSPAGAFARLPLGPRDLGPSAKYAGSFPSELADQAYARASQALAAKADKLTFAQLRAEEGVLVERRRKVDGWLLEAKPKGVLIRTSTSEVSRELKEGIPTITYAYRAEK